MPGPFEPQNRVSIDRAQLPRIDTRPDASISTAIRGFGTSLERALKAQEDAENRQAESDIEAFEAGEVAELESQLLGGPNQDLQSLPPETQAEVNQINSLQNAARQGGISNLHSSLRRAAKQSALIRKTPPRLRRRVRSAIGSPAQTLRAEAARQQSLQAKLANDSLRRMRKLQSDAATRGIVLNGAETESELVNMIALREKDEADLKQMNARLDKQLILQGTGPKQKQFAENTFQQSVATTTHALLSNTVQGFGSNMKEIRQQIAQLRANPGGQQANEQTANLQAAVGQIEQQVRQELRRLENSPIGSSNQTYAGLVTPERRKAIIDSALEPVLTLKQAINEKDFGLIELNALEVKLRDEARLEAIKKTKTGQLSVAMGDLQKLANNQSVVNTIFTKLTNELNLKQEGEELMEITQFFLSKHAAESQTQGKQLSEVETEMRQEPDVSDSTFRHLRRGAVSMLLKYDNPEMVRHAVNSLFGPNEASALSQYQADQRPQILMEMLRPDVIQKVRNLRGTPEWENFKTFVFQGFTEAFRQDVNTLIDEQRTNPFVEVKWNPKSSQIVIDDIDVPTTRTPFGGQIQLGGISTQIANENSSQIDDVKRSAGKINAYLTALKGVLEADGTGDSETVARTFLGVLQATDSRFQPTMEKEGPFLQRLGGAIRDFLTGGNEGTSEESGTPAPQQKIQDRLPQEEEQSSLDPGLVNLASAISIGEGTVGDAGYDTILGNAEEDLLSDNLTNMTLDEVIQFQQSKEFRDFSKRLVGRIATPVGKYQIVGKTLRSLKDQLGLSGTEVFTPELQDQLFVALLEGRGLRKFESGEITKRAFLNNLRKEWEGLKVNRQSFSAASSALDTL